MCEQDHSAAAKGLIGLLLEEYRALRSEVDQRIAARATLVGFLAAGAAFIVSSHRTALTWIAGAVVLVILVAVWGSSTAMLGRIGKTTRKLEKQINLLAKEAYGLSETPTLLEWEQSLISKPGWMRNLFIKTRLYKVDELDDADVLDSMNIRVTKVDEQP
jgi:hypothetical protein